MGAMGVKAWEERSLGGGKERANSALSAAVAASLAGEGTTTLQGVRGVGVDPRLWLSGNRILVCQWFS